MSIKKIPAGVDTPNGETDKHIHPNNITKRPWMASADGRCWHCERFRTERCNGLIDYHWRDCPIYRRER